MGPLTSAPPLTITKCPSPSWQEPKVLHWDKHSTDLLTACVLSLRNLVGKELLPQFDHASDLWSQKPWSWSTLQSSNDTFILWLSRPCGVDPKHPLWPAIWYSKPFHWTLWCQVCLPFFFFKLFLAVLGLRLCVRAFSSCGKWGPLFKQNIFKCLHILHLAGLFGLIISTQPTIVCYPSTYGFPRRLYSLLPLCLCISQYPSLECPHIPSSPRSLIWAFNSSTNQFFQNSLTYYALGSQHL